MDKSPDAFRTISEVADLLDTPAHVLRFWESRFPQIKPVKRAGGRRYYRPADVELLTGIRKLLHEDGLTIRGVQKVLREQGVRHVSGLSEEDAFDDDGLDIAQEPEPRSADPIPLFPLPTPPVASTPMPDHEDVVDDAVKDDAGEAEDLAPRPTLDTDSQPEVETVSSDEPSGDVEEEDMSEGLPATKPDREETAPELQFEPLAASQADALPSADSAPTDDDTSDSNNIFANSLSSVEDSADEGNDVKNVAAAEAESPDSEEEVLQAVADMMGADAISDAEQEVTPSADAAPMEKNALPVLDTSEIQAEWLPADLRAMYRGAFGAKQSQAEALVLRLEALRNRVGDLGRVPRR